MLLLSELLKNVISISKAYLVISLEKLQIAKEILELQVPGKAKITAENEHHYKIIKSNISYDLMLLFLS